MIWLGLEEVLSDTIHDGDLCVGMIREPEE